MTGRTVTRAGPSTTTCLMNSGIEAGSIIAAVSTALGGGVGVRVGVGVGVDVAKVKVQVKSITGCPSDARLNAPAGICIVWTPCAVTGELVNWKVIVVVLGVYNLVLAGVPLTVKSLASRVLGSTGSLTLTVKSVGWVTTTLPQAGSVLVTEKGVGVGVGVGAGVAAAANTTPR